MKLWNYATLRRSRRLPAEFLHLLVNHCICHNFVQGQVPFFVTATAGTTVLGAFDPFNDIADLCEEHGMWLHIDVSDYLKRCEAYKVNIAKSSQSKFYNFNFVSKLKKESDRLKETFSGNSSFETTFPKWETQCALCLATFWWKWKAKLFEVTSRKYLLNSPIIAA